MFRDMVIGVSQLEAGDPPMGCVSGIIKRITNIEEFSFFILNSGGTESDDEFRLDLNDEFSVKTESDLSISYSGGCILWYPDLDEAVIDLVGIPNTQYQQLFPDHIENYGQQF